MRRASAAYLAFISVFSYVYEAYAMDRVDRTWMCERPDKIFNLQISTPTLAVNNLFLAREPAPSTGIPVIQFSFSVLNKGDKDIHINAEIVGYAADGKTTFAISAGPLFGSISKKKLEQVTAGIYSNMDDLSRSDKVCVRFAGEY